MMEDYRKKRPRSNKVPLHVTKKKVSRSLSLHKFPENPSDLLPKRRMNKALILKKKSQVRGESMNKQRFGQTVISSCNPFFDSLTNISSKNKQRKPKIKVSRSFKGSITGTMTSSVVTDMHRSLNKTKRKVGSRPQSGKNFKDVIDAIDFCDGCLNKLEQEKVRTAGNVFGRSNSIFVKGSSKSFVDRRSSFRVGKEPQQSLITDFTENEPNLLNHRRKKKAIKIFKKSKYDKNGNNENSSGILKKPQKNKIFFLKPKHVRDKEREFKGSEQFKISKKIHELTNGNIYLKANSNFELRKKSTQVYYGGYLDDRAVKQFLQKRKLIKKIKKEQKKVDLKTCVVDIREMKLLFEEVRSNNYNLSDELNDEILKKNMPKKSHGKQDGGIKDISGQAATELISRKTKNIKHFFYFIQPPAINDKFFKKNRILRDNVIEIKPRIMKSTDISLIAFYKQFGFLDEKLFNEVRRVLDKTLNYYLSCNVVMDSDMISSALKNAVLSTQKHLSDVYYLDAYNTGVCVSLIAIYKSKVYACNLGNTRALLIKRVPNKFKKSSTFYGESQSLKNRESTIDESSEKKIRSVGLNDLLTQRRLNQARARSRSIIKRGNSRSSESSSSDSSSPEEITPLPKPILKHKRSLFSRDFKKLSSINDKVKVPSTNNNSISKKVEMTESLKVINACDIQEKEDKMAQKKITKLNQMDKYYDYKHLFDYHSPSNFTENFRICESEFGKSHMECLMKITKSGTSDPNEIKKMKSSSGIKESRRIQYLKDKLGDAFGPLRLYINNREMPCIPVTRCLGCFSGIESGLMSTPSVKEFELNASSVCVFIAGYELWETVGTQTVVNSVSEGLTRGRLEQANRDLHNIFKYEQHKLKRDKKFYHEGFDCAFILV